MYVHSDAAQNALLAAPFFNTHCVHDTGHEYDSSVSVRYIEPRDGAGTDGAAAAGGGIAPTTKR
jgi:hypothetical protein